tara:strand:- start:16276 stop:17289 length:1014 start_codon:yes stop_codon:yes gene_type:complete
MNATMSLDPKKHYPVMLNQVLSIISPQHGGTFIDCTFGGGGYSEEILKYKNTKVFALDRDRLVIKHADYLKEKFPKRFIFFKDKFSSLEKIIQKNIKPKAIIFDLGLSSLQLSDQERGFSFKSENSLSMEMGINKYSAYDVVNHLDKKTLTSIIKVLGDEKEGKNIANYIVNYRKKKPINNSNELSVIIKNAKKKYNNYKKNPATKTFQAIRIFVNQELTELVLALKAATKLLSEGGILLVVTFHSLEDKIVKNFFNFYSNLRNKPSRYFPSYEEKTILFNLKNKKPIQPDDSEIKNNIRSRSAKLRYAIRNDKEFNSLEEFERKFQNYTELEGMKV